MTQRKLLKRLSKFILYILERKPDEFGLVPDKHGFVKLKEFLKAVHEEDGYKYVRKNHVEEILLTLPNPSFEIKNSCIRATNQDKLKAPFPAKDLPKLLFTYIRRKAYPFALEKGIFPTGYKKVVLSSDRFMAERMGKRKDPKPVIITVHTRKTTDQGILFYKSGETLYLADSIPPGCFTGPPLPKEKPGKIKQAAISEKPSQKLSGGFLLDLENKFKKSDSKRDKKRKDKRKRKRKPPPWRN